MQLIDKQIRMYKDAIRACERRQAKGLTVTEDITFLKLRLKQLRKEKKLQGKDFKVRKNHLFKELKN